MRRHLTRWRFIEHPLVAPSLQFVMYHPSLHYNVSSNNADKLFLPFHLLRWVTLWLNVLHNLRPRVRRSILIRTQRREGGIADISGDTADVLTLVLHINFVWMHSDMVQRLSLGNWIVSSLLHACERYLSQMYGRYLRRCNNMPGKTNSICYLYRRGL